MSENPQVTAVLEYVEARERELAEQAAQIRTRLEELTAQLGELDAESENLRVTRKTLLTPFADTGQPMRARDLCQALDLPIIPKNTEGIRSKLKRLVARGILTEPEPGLFAQPRA
ncbi:hypothetical protein C1I97_37245 [Streptomyces sp. NTH33]|uniref:hypothetical protein n=1 Tax=Streptomyces sp. NTH33 TaxID=1735453 RepID=UPI000DA90B36|nr:hypothetical protein [Streptomyces sp. NTH33]PZG76166.1 hypothetical protein C1I97_37245 [Streptomyces sp. NTH33]